MPKKILVPLDGTPLGEAVLPHVSELARALDADVELIHVVPPSFVRGASPPRRAAPLTPPLGAPAMLPAYSPSETVLHYQFDPEEVEANRRYVERVATWLRGEGLRATAVVVEGPDVAEEVLRRAERVDMLALAAAAGHSGFTVGRLVFGSISERLLHECSTPMLLVRVPHAEG